LTDDVDAFDDDDDDDFVDFALVVFGDVFALVVFGDVFAFAFAFAAFVLTWFLTL
jgi:hypothetical protein